MMAVKYPPSKKLIQNAWQLSKDRKEPVVVYWKEEGNDEQGKPCGQRWCAASLQSQFDSMFIPDNDICQIVDAEV